MNTVSSISSKFLKHGDNAVIAIDARTFCYSDSVSRGIGHYALYHITAIVEARPLWNFVLLAETDQPPTCLTSLLLRKNVSIAVIDEVNILAYDMVHIPDPMNLGCGFDSPFRLFRGSRGSIIFYDLTPLRFYWDKFDNHFRTAYKSRLDQIKNGTWSILTISDFTRVDFLREFSMLLSELVGVKLDVGVDRGVELGVKVADGVDGDDGDELSEGVLESVGVGEALLLGLAPVLRLADGDGVALGVCDGVKEDDGVGVGVAATVLVAL